MTPYFPPLSPRALTVARLRLSRAEQLDAAAVKHCPRCDRTLSASSFGKHTGRADGLQPYCRGCRLASLIRPCATENISPTDKA